MLAYRGRGQALKVYHADYNGRAPAIGGRAPAHDVPAAASGYAEYARYPFFVFVHEIPLNSPGPSAGRSAESSAAALVGAEASGQRSRSAILRLTTSQTGSSGRSLSLPCWQYLGSQFSRYTKAPPLALACRLSSMKVFKVHPASFFFKNSLGIIPLSLSTLISHARNRRQ